MVCFLAITLFCFLFAIKSCWILIHTCCVLILVFLVSWYGFWTKVALVFVLVRKSWVFIVFIPMTLLMFNLGHSFSFLIPGCSSSLLVLGVPLTCSLLMFIFLIGSWYSCCSLLMFFFPTHSWCLWCSLLVVSLPYLLLVPIMFIPNVHFPCLLPVFLVFVLGALYHCLLVLLLVFLVFVYNCFWCLFLVIILSCSLVVFLVFLFHFHF